MHKKSSYSNKITPLFGRTRSSLQKAADVYQKLIVLCEARNFSPDDTDTLIAMMLASVMLQQQNDELDQKTAARKAKADELVMLAGLMIENEIILGEEPGGAA